MAASQRSPFNWHLPSDTGINRLQRAPAEQAMTSYKEPQAKSPGARSAVTASSPFSFDPSYFMPHHATRTAPAEWDVPLSQRSTWKQRGAIALFSALAVAGLLYYESAPLIREDKKHDADVSEPLVAHTAVLKWSAAAFVTVLLAETLYYNLIAKSDPDIDD